MRTSNTNTTFVVWFGYIKTLQAIVGKDIARALAWLLHHTLYRFFKEQMVGV